MLQLRNITKDYYVGDQTIHALRGLTVDFRKSEFVSVLGPSGCGKTTLMNIVGGLDRATEGDVLINGKSTATFKDADWDNYRNKRIGFIFQNYYLIPHLSIVANVELALTIGGVGQAERHARAKEALEKVGLSDQLNKRPNQLSGGQMQRVAIARALVNDPEILLADEPTGALDTKTSEQIMELVKEIAEDRLVIMVTHNAQLADRYSTRIIRMLDGEIEEDTAPYSSADDPAYINELAQIAAIAEAESPKKRFGRKKDKTSMSFFTALNLSLRNLFTKKGRTILTSVAGSIGIIGIALILAVSNGMNAYIAKMQSDMLSSQPITVSASSFNMEQLMNAMNGAEEGDPFPEALKVYVEKEFDWTAVSHSNNITDGYVTYVENNLDTAWYNDIVYSYGMGYKFFGTKNGQTDYLADSTWRQMPKNGFVSTQYDTLAGRLPGALNAADAYKEVVLVVNEYNQLSESALINLGFKGLDDGVEEFDFSAIIGTKFYAVSNDLYYTFDGAKYEANVDPTSIDYEAALEMTVVGILRINEATDSGVLRTGMYYSEEFCAWMLAQNNGSEIVDYMNETAADCLNPLTGLAFQDSLREGTKETQWAKAFRSYGGNTTPDNISIYPVSFEAKENIKTALDGYNTGKDDADIIMYTDASEIFGNMLSQMVNIITYVLIAFTAISLVVSSVMISIITYVSVIERTKEIGILRSIGARKRDVTTVFNAETFIIGLTAGLFGVVFAFILTFPISAIIKSLTGIAGMASLSFLHAVILVAISCILMLLAGLIPARYASKKDPVLALRTE